VPLFNSGFTKVPTNYITGRKFRRTIFGPGDRRPEYELLDQFRRRLPSIEVFIKTLANSASLHGLQSIGSVSHYFVDVPAGAKAVSSRDLFATTGRAEHGVVRIFNSLAPLCACMKKSFEAGLRPVFCGSLAARVHSAHPSPRVSPAAHWLSQRPIIQ
jgi:hypothetical protein